ncbi:MAG: hypothetical protein MJE63_16715 [Proteobacteria bacterium]|nr:hypothetical protein [Pseudomonadota bacterium]
MSDIIHLDQYKRRQQAKQCFKFWNAQFRDSFDEATKVGDLPDNVLLFIASPGEKSAGAVYQLIEQVKYPQTRLEEKDVQKLEMDLMDVHLHLADIFRYEMMYRLGWIESYPKMDCPLLDLIEAIEPGTKDMFSNPPNLKPDHPQYAEFAKLIPREKELFIRKLFVNALIEFNKKVNK